MLGATMGTQLKKLFSNLGLGQARSLDITPLLQPGAWAGMLPSYHPSNLAAALLRLLNLVAAFMMATLTTITMASLTNCSLLQQAQAHGHAGKPGAPSGRGGGGAKGAGGAREIRIEDEILAWVASRVSPSSMSQLMCVT